MNGERLIQRLQRHTIGPKVCETCGAVRGLSQEERCTEEGQCDFNRRYGLHTDGGCDVHQLKRDAALAAHLLEEVIIMLSRAQLENKQRACFDAFYELLGIGDKNDR